MKQEDLDSISKQLTKKQQLRARKSEEIRELTVEIEELNLKRAELLQASDDPIITDHAVVRYLERVEGLDVADIKNKILPDKTKESVKVLGSGKYTMDSHQVRVIGNKVVTVITDDNQPD